MVVMGWRKLGDDGEELCRVLDVVLGGIDALKGAIRRGQRLDGEGDAKVDSKGIWCPELCCSSPKMTPNVEDAKAALGRMKDTKKMLSSILGSLDDTINLVMNSIAQNCRAAGLASLPDEVLARIFELCHDRERHHYSDHRPDSAGILAAVCERFRRVAVHLPILWTDVSQATPTGRLSIHAARSSKLRVYLDGTFPERNIIERIHPCRDWEELHLRYQNAKEGVRLLEAFDPRVQVPFDSLERLVVNDDHIMYYSEEVDVSSASVEIDVRLVFWRFPNLTHLSFRNTLPPVPMHCPNVTSAEFIFGVGGRIAIWNPESFRAFLQSMPKLVSLAIGFECNLMKNINLNNVHAPVSCDPLALPFLKSLSVTLNGCPPLGFVSQFMDLVDTQSLTKLRVFINQGERPHESRLSVLHQMRNELSTGWVLALFSHPGDQHRVRPLPAVEDFSLDIISSSDVFQPSFHAMFKALPNVKDLSLKLPDFLKIDLCDWAQEHGGLRELRTMRISERTPWVAAKYSDFFRQISASAKFGLADERWDKFEKLEVVSSSIKSFQNEKLEQYLGDKLIWTGPKGN